MKLWFPLLLAAGLFACGTPCSHIAGAEAQVDQKFKNCGSATNGWTDAKVKTCEANLSKCSADEQKAMENYADCLIKLPACESSTSLTWGTHRLSCLTALNISLSCASGLN